MSDGTQGRAQMMITCHKGGSIVMLLWRTVRRTANEMINMLKSMACTENCPMYPFAVQAGPLVSCSSSLRRDRATAPEIVLLSAFIQSDLPVSSSFILAAESCADQRLVD